MLSTNVPREAEATEAYFRFAVAHAELLVRVAEAIARGTAADRLGDAARESLADWRDRALPLLGRHVAAVRAGAREVLGGDFARAAGLAGEYIPLSKNLGDNYLYDMQWAGPGGEGAIEAAMADVVLAASALNRRVAALPKPGDWAAPRPRRYGYLPPEARRVEVRLYAALAPLLALQAARRGAQAARPGAAGSSALAAADPVAAGTAAVVEGLRQALHDPAPAPGSGRVALPPSGLAVPAGELAAALRGPLAALDAALAMLVTPSTAEAEAAAESRAEVAALARTLAAEGAAG
jgi:hypothetical protein